MINQETLKELIIYDQFTGKCIWNSRLPKHFNISNSGRSVEWQANNWNSAWAYKPAFTAISTTGYYYGNLFSNKVFVHRLAWLYVTGDYPNVIDHINGDKLDNRFENLRNVTQSDNCKNSRMRSNNTTGYNGVYFNKEKGIFYTRINIDKKIKHLGVFETAEEAYKIRKQAEIEFGYHENHGRK